MKPKNVKRGTAEPQATIEGVEAFRIAEKKLSSATVVDTGDWARYCMRSVARTLTLCGKIPVVQYEGDDIVLYGVDPIEVQPQKATDDLGHPAGFPVVNNAPVNNPTPPTV